MDDFDSDSSDEDYVPDNDADEHLSDVAEDGDNSCDETEIGGDSRKRKRKGPDNWKRKGRSRIGDDTDQRSRPDAPDGDDEKVKLKADALWADFKKDVEPKKEARTLSSDTCSAETTRTMGDSQKITVTKVFDFAGEEIRVTEEVDANSKAAQKLDKFSKSASSSGANNDQTVQSSSVRKPAGLGSVLNKIGAKKKMSTLEKSRLDWNDFKTGEGIVDELKTFNKGKEGFLERQAFLHRTDERQFEIERSLRQASRNPQ